MWTSDVSTSLYILRDNEILSQDLFGILRQSNSSVETIDLKYADLNKAEIRRLFKAIKAGKLPQLKELELWNTLTGHLNDLFGGPDHPGFPSLEKLVLRDAHLNREDVESLSEAVRAGKLPKLNKLSLSHNDLSHMEREVKALIAAWDAHCEEWVKLNLYGTGLSEEFIQRCRDKYRNVEIICW